MNTRAKSDRVGGSERRVHSIFEGVTRRRPSPTPSLLTIAQRHRRAALHKYLIIMMMMMTMIMMMMMRMMTMMMIMMMMMMMMMMMIMMIKDGSIQRRQSGLKCGW